MRNRKFNLIFSFFLLAACILRIYLKFSVIDPSTGFYEGSSGLVLLFNLLLVVGIFFFLGLGFFERKQPFVSGPSRPAGIFAILSGIFSLPLAAMSLARQVTSLSSLDLEGLSLFMLLLQLLATLFSFLFLAVCPFLSAFLFLKTGISISRSPITGYRANPLLLLAPLFWQALFMLSLFMEFTAIRSASDQMLTILGMIALIPFLLGQGRLYGRLHPQKGILQLRLSGYPLVLLLAPQSLAALLFALSTGAWLDAAVSCFYLSLTGYAFCLLLSLRPRTR